VSVEPPDAPDATERLLTIFGRLFESEFVTLERFALSCRTPAGMRYLDESDALALMLGEGEPGVPREPADPAVHALHRTVYSAWPDMHAVVSGPSRHLRALLAEGCALPEPTSMMRKRGVTRLADHLVETDALAGPRVAASLAGARETATANGMNHVLLLEQDGTVHVAGRLAEEAMAHYSNVEFSARVACARIEEAFLAGLKG
jgi:ribulose-5-phosphate 4-epimerase/fuculose-1-phosphate aldolase